MRRTFTDIHSHILPGVDDGAQDEASAIELLKQLEYMGAENIILTPHYCRRRGFAFKKDKLEAVFEEFRKKCLEEGIKINLFLGMEMEYSTDTVRYINEGRILPLAGSKYLLTEFPPYVATETVVRASKEILQLGLTPIIAHIERYGCLYKNFDVLYMLKEIGVQFQLNVHSFSARRLSVRRFLKRVISENIVDYIAGDIHSDIFSEGDYDRCHRFVLKHSSAKYLEALINDNARKILDRR